jgi:hypothetical protein
MDRTGQRRETLRGLLERGRMHRSAQYWSQISGTMAAARKGGAAASVAPKKFPGRGQWHRKKTGGSGFRCRRIGRGHCQHARRGETAHETY